MPSEEEIRNWIKKHQAEDWEPMLIAKAMIIEAIQNTHWNEEAYPGIMEKLIVAVNKA